MASDSVLERAQKKLQVIDDSTPAEQPRVQPFKKGHNGGKVVDTPIFRISKAVGFQAGKVSAEDAKHEIEASKHFRKAMRATNNEPATAEENSIFIPICSDYLPDNLRQTEEFRVLKGMLDAGNTGYDPDEATWTANRIRKAQSYLAQVDGGSLVAPPAMGELIELMRPSLAVANAGATQVPLPAQGAISYPRQTGPSTMYWIGENTSITESSITTGRISLQGKKGAVFLAMPNELLKFSSVAADALFRSDMAKTLGQDTQQATQSDLDAVIKMLETQGAYDAQYDYNGDKVIDQKDKIAIETYLKSQQPDYKPDTDDPFKYDPAAGSKWARTGVFKTVADEAEATRQAQAADAEKTRQAQAAAATNTQRMGNLNTLTSMLGQAEDTGGQHVTVKAADPAKIGYIYDWNSIFANPSQEKLFASPFAQGGMVDGSEDVNDELLKILKG